MINHIEATLENVAAHYIGNYNEAENVVYSPSLLSLEDDDLHDLLIKYFITHFKEPEYFNFTFSSFLFT